MTVTLYSLRCDGPLCRVEADLCGLNAAAVEKKLVRIGGWSVERQAARGGAKTRHYCPRCTATRRAQAELDNLIRSL